MSFCLLKKYFSVKNIKYQIDLTSLNPDNN